MKSILLSTLLLTFGLTANASDHWDYCSNASGDISLEGGTLYIDGIGEIAEESVSVKELSVVKKERETCTLAGGGYEVIAYDNTISVKEVTFTIEEGYEPSTAIMLCEFGGSGIPANDQCKL